MGSTQSTWGVQSLPSWPILPSLLSVLWHSSWCRPCPSPGTREMASQTAHRENARARLRSRPSSAAPTSPCSLTTDTPRTVRKARSATQRPPMLPREIHADLLEEEKRRVMRGNDAFVEDKIVSKINQSTVVPLKWCKVLMNYMYTS